MDAVCAAGWSWPDLPPAATPPGFYLTGPIRQELVASVSHVAGGSMGRLVKLSTRSVSEPPW